MSPQLSVVFSSPPSLCLRRTRRQSGNSSKNTFRYPHHTSAALKTIIPLVRISQYVLKARQWAPCPMLLIKHSPLGAGGCSSFPQKKIPTIFNPIQTLYPPASSGNYHIKIVGICILFLIFSGATLHPVFIFSRSRFLKWKGLKLSNEHIVSCCWLSAPL